jgi:hypothetical protein
MQRPGSQPLKKTKSFPKLEAFMLSEGAEILFANGKIY